MPGLITRAPFIGALIIGACVARPPAAGTPVEVRYLARSASPATPADFACSRHSECTEVGEATARGACEHAMGNVAVRLESRDRLVAAWTAACVPLPDPCSCGSGPATCCPPVAQHVFVPTHPACVEGLCVVRAGASLTRDEQREESEGHGTLSDGGACYLDSECPAPAWTAFPLGVADATGRAYCPVCPRPGPVLADEAGRVAALAGRCPALRCAPIASLCDHRTCVPERVRPERVPVLAVTFPTEPVVTEVPALPDDEAATCRKSSECVVVPACCWGQRIIARAFVEKARQGCQGMPCNQPRDLPPEGVITPVCFEARCTSADNAAQIRPARARRERDLRAHQAWLREYARIRASLSRFEENEIDDR